MKKTKKKSSNSRRRFANTTEAIFADAIASVKAEAKEAIANQKARADEAKQLAVKVKDQAEEAIAEAKAKAEEKEKNCEATVARLKAEYKEMQMEHSRQVAKLKVEHKEHIKKLKSGTEESLAQIKTEVEKVIVKQEASIVKAEKQAAQTKAQAEEAIADIKSEACQKEKAYDQQIAKAIMERRQAIADIRAENEELIAKIMAETAEEQKAHEQQVAKLRAEVELASGAVSEAIRKMVDSPAVLPGQQSLTVLDLCAKDIMQTDVVWASPDDTIEQTLAIMQRYTTDYVIVGNGSVLTGIVSRSDLSASLSPYLRPAFDKWRRPLDDATLQIKLSLIMSRPVHTISPEMSLAAVIRNMCRCRVRCLPVVDQQGKVHGVVAEVNIFKALLKAKSTAATFDSDKTLPETVQESALSLPNQARPWQGNESFAPAISIT